MTVAGTVSSLEASWLPFFPEGESTEAIFLIFLMMLDIYSLAPRKKMCQKVEKNNKFLNIHKILCIFRVRKLSLTMFVLKSNINKSFVDICCFVPNLLQPVAGAVIK